MSTAAATAGERSASVGAYLDELAQQRRLSPHTVDNYRRDLQSLCRLIGELPRASGDGRPSNARSEIAFDAIQTLSLIHIYQAVAAVGDGSALAGSGSAGFSSAGFRAVA